VCLFRCGLNDEARETAESALLYADGSEYNDLRKQINDVIKASSQPAWTGDMNRAVEKMNSENWLEAWSHLNDVLKKDRSNATAHYYQALCWFKFTMDPLQKQRKKIQPHEVDTYITAMETVLESLDKAESNSSWSDKDLRKGINNLREAASNILKQLRGY
jgi:molecular chaperone GrpE (heat shock protein)